MNLLEKAKLSLRIKTDAFDVEISDLIEAAKADLNMTDISEIAILDSGPGPAVTRAILTYVKMNFGEIATDVYDRLKRSYDEQKAQMLMSSEYTEF